MDGDPSRVGRWQGVPAPRRRRAPLPASHDPHQGSIAATTIGADARNRLHASQDRPRRDAQGRGDHGRHERRAGGDRRRGRRSGRHGPRARARGHPSAGRRRAHGRPGQGDRDPGGRDDPGHGQGSDRPLCRGSDPRGARGRLHRRERGARHRPTRSTTSTNGASPCRSSAAAASWEKPCGASPRARR